MERPRGRALSVVRLLLVGLLVLPGTVAAQTPSSAPPGPPARTGEQRVWYKLGRVTTLAGSPLLGAAVAVYVDSKATPDIQFKTSFQGEFEISLKTDSDKSHWVKVVAKKDGYHDATETLEVTFDGKTDVIELVLRGDEEDADQLPLGTLISSVGERLRATTGTSATPTERSDTLRAAQALLDARDTDGALRRLAKAVEREPNCVEFRTLQALAMLEAGSWSGATRQLTESAALNASAAQRTRRSEPNLILGVLECWRGNPQTAAKFFLQALDTEPQSPLALQELGRAHLLQQNWSGADTFLARAIQAGASPEARLMRAQALLGEAKPNDAQAEMGTYLGGRKPKDLPRLVRLWWIKLTYRMELEFESEASTSKTVVKQTPEELLETLPELKGLEPAKSQEELSSILQEVGERVEAFFRDFHSTTSQEVVRQELLRRNGRVSSSLDQKYQYWLLTWPDPSRPALEEYRTNRRGEARPLPGAPEQGFILTTGFASTSHFLLPAYQTDSTFVLLGRQRIESYETYVVAFAQRPEIARLLARFRASDADALTLSQGVAWIECNTYQVIRMRTDLLNPVARARLERETTEVHYSEVRFKDVPLSFWLPRDVVVTVEWKGKLRRNRHTYSDFHLFSVEAKISAAAEPGKGP